MRVSHAELTELRIAKSPYSTAVSLGLMAVTMPRTYREFVFKNDGFKTKSNLNDTLCN